MFIFCSILKLGQNILELNCISYKLLYLLQCLCVNMYKCTKTLDTDFVLFILMNLCIKILLKQTKFPINEISGCQINRIMI